MAYQATVIPIMIASPGDVVEERDIIRRVIYDWNDINASDSGIMLSPMGWDTHSAPEIGDRPQGIINKRILAECDLLVGVFWTQIGTPTGKAESGTVEEIQEHVKTGKPAMIYFSSKPVAPESYDQEQFKAVQEFKKWCKSNGLVEEFVNAEQFKSKFSKQLPMRLRQDEYLQKLLKPTTTTDSDTSIGTFTPTNHPTLSQEAMTLLREAAKTRDGTIVRLDTISGRLIIIGEVHYGEENARAAAKWESGLNELIRVGFVIGRGHKGQMFELTHQGWSVADQL